MQSRLRPCCWHLKLVLSCCHTPFHGIGKAVCTRFCVFRCFIRAVSLDTEVPFVMKDVQLKQGCVICMNDRSVLLSQGMCSTYFKCVEWNLCHKTTYQKRAQWKTFYVAIWTNCGCLCPLLGNRIKICHLHNVGSHSCTGLSRQRESWFLPL